MPSRAKSSPKCWATSRAAGSVPKRAPQKTQREEGAGFTLSTRTGNRRFYLQTIRRLSGPTQHGIISQRKVATPMGSGSRTVGRVMSRTVIWLVVGGAIVIAAGLGGGWQGRGGGA